MMRTNASITIIRNIGDKYVSTYFDAVMRQGVSGMAISNRGEHGNDGQVIYIPMDSTVGLFEPRSGDTVCVGKISGKIDSDAYRKILSDPQTCRIVSVSRKDYGSSNLQHWRLDCE